LEGGQFVTLSVSGAPHTGGLFTVAMSDVTQIEIGPNLTKLQVVFGSVPSWTCDTLCEGFVTVKIHIQVVWVL